MLGGVGGGNCTEIVLKVTEMKPSVRSGLCGEMPTQSRHRARRHPQTSLASKRGRKRGEAISLQNKVFLFICIY